MSEALSAGTTNDISAATSEAAIAPLLIVADTSLMRLRTAAVLKKHGVATVEADGATDALEAYAAVQPAGVLLDGSRLESQGVTVIAELTALDPAARVALLTSRADRGTVIAAAEAGVRDLIVTPVTDERLLQAAQTLLTPPERRQHRRLPVCLAGRLGLGARPEMFAPCRLTDLSVGGARLTLDVPSHGDACAAGTVAHLRFALPDRAGLILATGHVARLIAPDGVAMAFMHLSTAHAARIAAYCQQLHPEPAAP